MRIVVVDSVSFHFRRDFRNMALRVRLMNEMAQQLHTYAHQYKLPVSLPCGRGGGAAAVALLPPQLPCCGLCCRRGLPVALYIAQSWPI